MGNEKKLELVLQVSEDGKIVSNANELKSVIYSKLQTYDYEVNENNLDEQTKTRAGFNKLAKIIATKRKEANEKVNEIWKPTEKTLKECEKMLENAGKKIGEGLDQIESKVKQAKRFEIEQTYQDIHPLSDFVDLQVFFNDKWLNKTYTMKLIVEQMEELNKDFISKTEMMNYFLPQEEEDREQIKDVFYKTLDIGLAKQKADYLLEIRNKVRENEQKIAQTEEIPVAPVIENVDHKHETEMEHEQEFQKKQKLTRYEVIFIGTRSFYDDMNQLILKHKPQVKVLSKEEL